MVERKSKVLIVDDHPIVRRGARQLIDQDPDLITCDEAENAEQALEKIIETRPDAVLVDISLEATSGLELIKSIKAGYPHVPTLVLSMHDELLYAERALKAGARGYIMKQQATSNIVAAIHRVLQGEVYVSDQIASRMVRGIVTGQAFPSLAGLTDRELEVFETIGRGHSTSRIAEMLHLSVKTVESHRANIKDKLGLKSGFELLRFAIQWVESRK